MWSPLLIGLLGVSGAAAVGLIIALRGRRIDDHPLCRRCRYDLSGTPEVPDCCPECGHDLAPGRAIRIGNRRRRRASALCSSAIFVIGIVASSVIIYSHARNVDWNAYKPAWLLLMEAEGDFGRGGRAAALDELRQRFDAGDLSASARADLLDLVLDLQKQRDPLWTRLWVTSINAARATSAVGDEHYRRFLHNALDLAISPLEARPSVRRGQPVPFRITFNGALSPGRVGVRKALSAATLGGRPLELDPADKAPNEFKFYNRLRSEDVGVGDLPVGVHELVVTWTLEADLLDPNARQRWNDITFVNGEPVFRQTFARSATVEIVPADEPILEHVDSPEIRDQIRAGLEGRLHGVTINLTRGEIEHGGEPLGIALALAGTPVAVDADIYFVREDGSEELKDRLRGTPLGPRIGSGFEIPLVNGEVPASFTLMIRARPARAEETVDIVDSVWSGELLLTDVRITNRGKLVIPPTSDERTRDTDR